jgi:hypothetical protein
MTAVDEEIVTMLRDLHAKVDALQRSQATSKTDIIDHILSVLKARWKDDEARRRERTWQ